MRIAFVCTGNTCRSPMAIGFARRWIERNGVDAELASAGLLRGGNPATPEGVKAMAEHDIDISTHLSTQLTGQMLTSQDLIVAMAVNHVREAVALDPGLWARTFTLRELARRTQQEGPRGTSESIGDYLIRCSVGRDPSAMASMLSNPDDIEDPIGRGIDEYRRCADEIGTLVTQALEHIFPRAEEA